MDDELVLGRQKLRLAARDALADYLRTFPWDDFITVTFERPANYPRLAIKRTTRALHSVARAFIAAEPHKLGNYHCHGLVYWGEDYRDEPGRWDPRKDRTLAAINALGFSRLSPIRQVGEVAGYCAKYLTKERRGDWTLYGNWHDEYTW